MSVVIKSSRRLRLYADFPTHKLDFCIQMLQTLISPLPRLKEPGRMFDLLIRNGQVVTSAGVEMRSLGIQDGRVAAILAPDEDTSAREVLDLHRQLVMPGLIDAHVHYREPGLVHKEGFVTGSLAAAAGGVTTVMVMPTDNPMTTTAELFIEKKELAAGRCHVDYALQAGLGPDVQHVRALADLGAVSFEIFMADLAPPMLTERTSDLLNALAAVRDVAGVAGITPGDDSIVLALSAAAQARGATDRLDFARTRPPIAEAVGLARACIAVAETGVRAHIRQVSCAASVAVLRALAPKSLSSEVTPHNLCLDEQEIVRQGPIAKVVPPLRPRSDIDAVREALRDGLIQMVATDHAPHLPKEKDAGLNDIWKAPGGFPGLQTFLPLMLRLVADDVLTYRDLVRVCCEEPARRFGLYPRKGALGIGADADIVVVDPQRPFTLRNADQQSKAAMTPFDGWEIPATPTLAFLRGNVIMRDGRPQGEARGNFISPSA
jgi:dihydroorotase